MVIPVAPGGTPRQLTNEAHAQAELGSSVFSPFDTAKVVQTDITLTKTVDVTTPAPGDVITFTLEVANTSTTVPEETAVFITDPVPADTTYVSGSVDITSDPGGYWSATFDQGSKCSRLERPVLPGRNLRHAFISSGRQPDCPGWHRDPQPRGIPECRDSLLPLQ